MTTFAYIENGIVTNVIVIEQDQIDTGLFGNPAQFVIDNNQRAGIGYKYDGVDFIAPAPYPSWVLRDYVWYPPIDYPKPREDGTYYWNEVHQRWDFELNG